jgi:predicted transcriptional regulator
MAPDYVEANSPMLSWRRSLTRHDLTPNAYRPMFNHLDDDPLMAPTYAARRSGLTIKIGLGRKLGPSKRAMGSDEDTKKPGIK